MSWETLVPPNAAGHKDSVVPVTGNPEFFTFIAEFKVIHWYKSIQEVLALKKLV